MQDEHSLLCSLTLKFFCCCSPPFCLRIYGQSSWTQEFFFNQRRQNSGHILSTLPASVSSYGQTENANLVFFSFKYYVLFSKSEDARIWGWGSVVIVPALQNRNNCSLAQPTEEFQTASRVSQQSLKTKPIFPYPHQRLVPTVTANHHSTFQQRLLLFLCNPTPSVRVAFNFLFYFLLSSFLVVHKAQAEWKQS